MRKPGKVYAKQAGLKGIPQAKIGRPLGGRKTVFYWITPGHEAMLIELAARADMGVGAYLEAMVTLRYEQVIVGRTE